MTTKGLFAQNVLAIVWDFDRTLSPDYMQKPLFEAYDVDEDRFWAEVNALPAYYARGGVHVDKDTCYLGHLLTYVRHGRFPGLTNARLRELGARIRFFPGIPEALSVLADTLREPGFEVADLRLEHYVVSTGLAEIVRGSSIAGHLDGIWACEFIEVPAPPDVDLSGAPEPGPISQIAALLNNTTKTRALFEINKGVNKTDAVSVNDTIPEGERRVPFRNMVYIADGPSDIPSFSVVKRGGGLTLAVFNPESDSQYAQAADLHESGRVHFFGPADYTANSETMRWLRHQTRKMARRMVEERRKTTESVVRKEPVHIHEDRDKQ